MSQTFILIRLCNICHLSSSDTQTRVYSYIYVPRRLHMYYFLSQSKNPTLLKYTTNESVTTAELVFKADTFISSATLHCMYCFTISALFQKHKHNVVWLLYTTHINGLLQHTNKTINTRQRHSLLTSKQFAWRTLRPSTLTYTNKSAFVYNMYAPSKVITWWGRLSLCAYVH